MPGVPRCVQARANPGNLHTWHTWTHLSRLPQKAIISLCFNWILVWRPACRLLTLPESASLCHWNKDVKRTCIITHASTDAPDFVTVSVFVINSCFETGASTMICSTRSLGGRNSGIPGRATFLLVLIFVAVRQRIHKSTLIKLYYLDEAWQDSTMACVILRLTKS